LQLSDHASGTEQQKNQAGSSGKNSRVWPLTRVFDYRLDRLRALKSNDSFNHAYNLILGSFLPED
jgi:hypothetical protein